MDLFHRQRLRLNRLNAWLYIASVPTAEAHGEFDQDLISMPEDEWNSARFLVRLKQRVHDCRAAMNLALSSTFTAACSLNPQQATAKVAVRPSNIPGGGMGLFATAPFHSVGLPICRYGGEIHDQQSQRVLLDRSYLLWLGKTDMYDGHEIFVDAAGPACTEVVARYVNDPINPRLSNARFVGVPDKLCAKIVTTRPIAVDEEIYVNYGEVYWAGQPATPVYMHGVEQQVNTTSVPVPTTQAK
jgi:hypothetical protein